MRKERTIRMIIGSILLFMIVATPFYTPLNTYFSIPNELTAFQNDDSIPLPDFGEHVTVEASNPNIKGTGQKDFIAKQSGQSDLIYKYAGLPIKKVDVQVLDDLKLIPGGESIGVHLHTEGVLVVGHHRVTKDDDTKISPGEDADIQVGDIILKINGETIEEMGDVKPIVEQAGENDETMDLTLKRGNEKYTTQLHPEKALNDDAYQIGLYIRDSAAGIGTMTFHDPESKKYGALGHVISDMDTQKPVEIYDGSILQSTVESIRKASDGNPGEKQAKFSKTSDKIGTITKNSPFGIFGKLTANLQKKKWNKPMPIALAEDVEEGPAKILTVIEGEEVQAFDVNVVNSVDQDHPSKKGLIIEVTDDELLEKTGGIVQGMSGSPIIQDGKIIGSVTHVFVNDSTSGYGVHIEWMLEEAGINIYEQEEKAS